ncbi:MAG: hypothetical protein Q8Q23_05355 [bacterium]|nr:hypothetical protein [bacterium]
MNPSAASADWLKIGHCLFFTTTFVRQLTVRESIASRPVALPGSV